MIIFGKEIQAYKAVLFLIGVVIFVSTDFFIKAQVEKNLSRPWSQDLVIQGDETLLMFNQDPKKDRILVREVVVIKDFWSFTYIRNYNVGFSLLNFIENYLSPMAQKIFLQMFQLMAVILVAYYFFFYAIDHPYAFFLIISGGLGNVVDRWQRGYVVDYVKWYIKDSPIEILNPWPIFNLADSAITVGAGLLLIGIFFNKKSSTSPEIISQEKQNK